MVPARACGYERTVFVVTSPPPISEGIVVLEGGCGLIGVQ